MVNCNGLYFDPKTISPPPSYPVFFPSCDSFSTPVVPFLHCTRYSLNKWCYYVHDNCDDRDVGGSVAVGDMSHVQSGRDDYDPHYMWYTWYSRRLSCPSRWFGVEKKARRDVLFWWWKFTTFSQAWIRYSTSGTGKKFRILTDQISCTDHETFWLFGQLIVGQLRSTVST